MEWGGGGELREFRSTPKQKLGGQSPDFHGCIWQIQMTYMTSELVIFCPEKTEELPKKHNEAGPPEQLLPDALSQIDYKHTIHCEDCLCQQTMQRAFWKNWVGVIAYGWVEDHPPRLHLPERKEEGSIKWWWKQNINLATWNIKTP